MTDTTAPDAITQADRLKRVLTKIDAIPADYPDDRAEYVTIGGLRALAAASRLAAHGAGEGLREAAELLCKRADEVRENRGGMVAHSNLLVATIAVRHLLATTLPADAGSTTREGGEGVFARALAEWGDELEQPDSTPLWEHPLSMLFTLGDIRRAALATTSSPDASPDSGRKKAFSDGVYAAVIWIGDKSVSPDEIIADQWPQLEIESRPAAPSPAIVREAGEVGHVRELLAEAYKDLSGRDLHASDCATSLAPAYTPGPCDCYPRVLFLNWPAEKIDEPVGWKGENPPTPDHFQCEFCGESNLDCTLIPHRQNCPVTSARAALSASNAAQVSK